MTELESAKLYAAFKQDLLENVDCFTNNFTELKEELEAALKHINKQLEKSHAQ